MLTKALMRKEERKPAISFDDLEQPKVDIASLVIWGMSVEYEKIKRVGSGRSSNSAGRSHYKVYDDGGKQS